MSGHYCSASVALAGMLAVYQSDLTACLVAVTPSDLPIIA